MNRTRVAVIGVGAFGRNHVRVLSQSQDGELAGVLDADPNRAAAVSAEFGCPVFASLGEIAGRADAAIIATPTSSHAEIGTALLEAGLDVLVEKPIAAKESEARALIDAAARSGRILQVGHLERFNPAITALRDIVTVPLFFEIHRLSVFSPRSLDVDVVLDLMIHDLDVVLDLVGFAPERIDAAGLSILSDKVDIANVRLAFSTGCIANLTASRVSTERIRKMRLFQPHQYISIDYQRQDAIAFTVSAEHSIGFQNLPVAKDEPLRIEIEAFLLSVRTRRRPVVTGEHGLRALETALSIQSKIDDHLRVVRSALDKI